ncbi:MAG TPA: BMP family ABC transporter substrate-binding protein, partial [Candidatus Ozemobacteraceae bacterium]|nr:BMP family ABC transporter substrate-binding protein [Candidatus Ozemobacteraceae bacterium]
MRPIIRLALCLVVFCLLATIATAQDPASTPTAGKRIKAGFIYVGPIGDFGWTNAHEQARQQMVKLFPWLDTTFVESVAEGDCARVIDRLVNEEHCDVVFTTSFGYMNDTAAAAARYPDRKFMHCSGYKRGPNQGTYFAELYQAYYLNGLMAGALTKSGKLGYVASHPIPEVVRHINAFALGSREANPKARVQVKWLFSWYDPAKAREAAEALVAEGCDALAFSEDSPAVIQVGEEHTQKGKQILSFSHYSPMQKFGEHSVVSGQLVDWGVLYEMLFSSLYTGTWKPNDHWWLLKEGACRIGGAENTPINPAFAEPLKAVTITDPVIGATNVHDFVFKRIAQM